LVHKFAIDSWFTNNQAMWMLDRTNSDLEMHSTVRYYLLILLTSPSVVNWQRPTGWHMLDINKCIYWHRDYILLWKSIMSRIANVG